MLAVVDKAGTTERNQGEKQATLAAPRALHASVLVVATAAHAALVAPGPSPDCHAKTTSQGR